MLTRAKRRRLDVDIMMLPSTSEVEHEARIGRIKSEVGALKVVELR